MRSLFLFCGFCCLYVCSILISAYISTPESVIDSILVDAPQFIIGQGDDTAQVLAVENIVRCGPMSIGDTLTPTNITVNISACIAMDNLKVSIKYLFFKGKLTVGHLKLAVNVTVVTGLKPTASAKAEIIEWTDAKIEIGISIPADIFKKTIENELTKALNQLLQMLLQIDNNMNPYNKTLIYK